MSHIHADDQQTLVAERKDWGPWGAGAHLLLPSTPAVWSQPGRRGTAELWWELTVGPRGGEPVMFSQVPTAAGVGGPRALGGAAGEGAGSSCFPH